MKALLCCLLLAAACVGSAQPSPKDDFVLSGEKAYGLMPPEPVCGGQVSRLEWSTDGRYLLAVRRDLGPATKIQHFIEQREDPRELVEQSIVVYSVADRKSMVAWSTRSPSVRISDVSWFKGSDTATVVLTEMERVTDPTKMPPTRETVLLIDGSTGSARPVLSMDDVSVPGDLSLVFSPSKPFALVQFTSREVRPGGAPNVPKDLVFKLRYRILAADGTLSSPEDLEGVAGIVGWTADGASPIVTRFSFPADGKPLREQLALDLRTGALSKPQGALYADSDSPPAPGASQELRAAYDRAHPLQLQLQTTSIGGPSHKAKTARSLWLRASSGEGDSLVAESVEGQVSAYEHGPVLSPTLKAVAYVSHGIAMVRSIITMPKELYLQALAAALKSEVISNAKQVGLGLLMYATDYDDTLPSSQLDVAKLIEPYMKDPSVYSGFVYSFAGGALGSVDKPAETVLGYMPGPGGKAVVYVDGHVTWQPDQ